MRREIDDFQSVFTTINEQGIGRICFCNIFDCCKFEPKRIVCFV